MSPTATQVARPPENSQGKDKDKDAGKHKGKSDKGKEKEKDKDKSRSRDVRGGEPSKPTPAALPEVKSLVSRCSWTLRRV